MTVSILVGDCRDVLRTLPDESVHCVVTSPPYWGLRDYGVDGQIGLEGDFTTYVQSMVGVFAEVRRVLRADGTLWLNMGDSYATGAGKVGQAPGGGKQGERWAAGRGDRDGAAGKHGYAGTGTLTQPNRMPQAGLKPKDLVGMPWRIAFALQAEGWVLRQEIIWSKPAPMPESVTDRCTKAHEHLFLLAKSKRYYFDQEAIIEDCSPNTHARSPGNAGWKTPDGWDTSKGSGGHGSFHKEGREKGQTGYEPKAVSRRGGGNRRHKGTEAYEAGADEHRTKAGLVAFSEKQRKLAEAGSGTKNNDSFDAAMAIMPTKRNKRSVWTVPSQGFKEAHFATFPPALIEPCILAGCPEGGTVLDPFGGAGTTGMVADRLGRNSILIELNPKYAAMAERRINGDAGMFAAVTVTGA